MLALQKFQLISVEKSEESALLTDYAELMRGDHFLKNEELKRSVTKDEKANWKDKLCCEFSQKAETDIIQSGRDKIVNSIANYEGKKVIDLQEIDEILLKGFYVSKKSS